jgi:DNA adenine methylase
MAMYDRTAAHPIHQASYPGGKSGAGVYHRIIRLIPRHEHFISAFAGRCGVLRHMRWPSRGATVIDTDNDVAWWWAERGARVICGDALAILPVIELAAGDVVYCDPPYLHSTRTHRRIYRHELSDSGHEQLLSVVKRLSCRVLISGYDNPLYRSMLDGWHVEQFQAMTRGGLRTETVWMNYLPPQVPHDLRYVGANYRERERIGRKARRWASQLAAMQPGERAAVLQACIDASADIAGNIVIDDGGSR